MRNSLNRQVTSLQRKTVELMMATPVVVSRRVGRALVTPSTTTQRDKREFNLMASEKVEAMVESWVAIGRSVAQSNQRNFQAAMYAWMNPRTYRELALGRVPRALSFQWGGLADDVTHAALKGLDPVHRRAVANAKRLSSK